MNRTGRAVVWAVGMAVLGGAGAGAWAQSSASNATKISNNKIPTPASIANSQGKTITGPLLETQWWMRSPYIDLAPEKSRIGCGGVAGVQIMRYHKHPIRGIGQSEAYTTTHGVNVPSVNFENFVFDWDNTLNRYTANSGTEPQRKTIAEIYYHVTVGIKMDFGKNGAGGTMRSFDDIMVGLTTYFGYDKSVKRLERIYYDDTTWERTIKEQLDARLPILYHGTDEKRSFDHMVIIDGYDNNSGKYHVNWGWNGAWDGWYYLHALNTDANNINYNHRMWINIKPDAGGIAPDYEIVLDKFSVQRTSVAHNERFEVYTYMKNVNNSSARFLGGQAGAALTDNNNNIVAIIGTSAMGEGSFWSKLEDRPINCSVPNTVSSGQYSLKIATKRTGGDWKIVTLSAIRDGVPTALDFEVR